MPPHNKTKRASVSIETGKDRVYFFKMNGCGHCIALQSIWNEVVDQYTKSKSPVIFIEIESGKIDDDTTKKLNLETDQIMGYPDLRILNANGKISKFNSNRTVEELVKWIKENTVNGSNPHSHSRSIKRVPTPYPGKTKTKRLAGGRRRKRTRRHRRSARKYRRIA